MCDLSDIIFKSTQDTKRIDRKDVRISQAVLSSVYRARIYLSKERSGYSQTFVQNVSNGSSGVVAVGKQEQGRL